MNNRRKQETDAAIRELNSDVDTALSGSTEWVGTQI